MNILLAHIDKQIAFNRGKNLFYRNQGELFYWLSETDRIGLRLKNLTKTNEKFLLEYTTDKTLEEFCNSNQYFSFDEESRLELKSIYTDLLNSLKSSKNIDEVKQEHFCKLKRWLELTNKFSKLLYKNSEERIEYVPCDEYSAPLQLNLLNIRLNEIIEPVLDIGCGKEGNLVSFLRQNGIEAFGIDRFAKQNNYCKKDNWLTYDFGEYKWGTIISNLGFSNHFKHHHFRADGNYIEYAKQYMAILKSLVHGGSFCYAPDLPFIEEHLNIDCYFIRKHKILGTNFNVTILRKN